MPCPCSALACTTAVGMSGWGVSMGNSNLAGNWGGLWHLMCWGNWSSWVCRLVVAGALLVAVELVVPPIRAEV